ncbi:MAG: GTPase [Oligosphaeraceae bacterium]
MDEQNHLRSCRILLEQAAQQLLDIGHRHRSQAPDIDRLCASVQSFIQTRLDDLNPKIMVYGIYNAGKSTLLNALMGEAKAPMNDIPTTKRVVPYPWHEYTIFDTPGINAPEKDEELSKAQLEQSDVILFVMDTEGTFSLAKNYRELADIIRQGKHLLIVLNNKSERSLADEPDHFETIKQNVYADLAACFPNETPEGLASKIRLLVVNAQDALFARTTPELPELDRQTILEASNLPRLEEAIIEEYGRTSGFTILNQLKIRLLDLIAQLADTLLKLRTDAESQRTTDAFAELQNLQDSIQAQVSDHARDLGKDLGDDIYSLLLNCSDQSQAEHDIMVTGRQFAEQLNDFLLQQLQNASGRTQKIMLDFAGLSAADLDLNLPQPTNGTDAPSSLTLFPEGHAPRRHGCQPDGGLLPLAAPLAGKAIATGLTKALPVIQNIPLVGVLLTKVIGPVIPVIGPIITILSALSLFGGGRDRAAEEEMLQLRRQAQEQERQQREIARQKQTLHDESRRIARKLIAGMIASATDLIAQAFKADRDHIAQTAQRQQGKLAAIIDDLQALNDIRSRLENQLGDIGAL